MGMEMVGCLLLGDEGTRQMRGADGVEGVYIRWPEMARGAGWILSRARLVSLASIERSSPSEIPANSSVKC